MIRTRFAPSPTGYLHIGGARTALFSWAYARRHGGKFVLRIEDTDLDRSTQASVDAILEGMKWLGLDWDEGPFYQMHRIERYREVVRRLLDEGHAYYCYTTPKELDALREEQRARGEKPRYDGRWRPEPGKRLPTPPMGVQPVVRFKTPLDGEAAFNDLIKGPIAVANAELDDLVILRADGTPTYNFGVVVDDWDMGITHVIRGDDHVNNTPRQVNMLDALGAPIPLYAHVPMILGGDGERLSKRHGAVSVLQYREDGYLPEALLNYLARLGWSHGDDEVFSPSQFVEWFDLAHVSRSPARFDMEKLAWLNREYMKGADDVRLATLAAPLIVARGGDVSGGPSLAPVVALLKERANTVEELADAALLFYRELDPAPDALSQHLTAEALPALHALAAKLAQIEWERGAIHACVKEIVVQHQLKLPKLAMPLRLLVTGESQTPSVDVTLELLGRERVLDRLRRRLPRLVA
jgi:glutamyl-tRNA synthetase